MRSEFITDVEQQYEVYCKIAEEYGFIDLNAKKNGFRCTTKSNEFNAGWIAFTGAIAAMREDEQSKVDELQKRVDASLIAFEKLKEEINQLHGQCDLHLIKYLEEKAQVLEQALKGGIK